MAMLVSGRVNHLKTPGGQPPFKTPQEIVALIDKNFEDLPPRGLSNVLVALAYLDGWWVGFPLVVVGSLPRKGHG